jgi:hypothetical protein
MSSFSDAQRWFQEYDGPKMHFYSEVLREYVCEIGWNEVAADGMVRGRTMRVYSKLPQDCLVDAHAAFIENTKGRTTP